jgi:hypothetical protein
MPAALSNPDWHKMIAPSVVYFYKGSTAQQLLHSIMPGQQQQNNEDYVAPRDKAEALAEDYEGSHHDRAGHDKPAPSHQSKPHSVRQN